MNGIIGTRERLLRLVGALALAGLVVSLLLLTDLLAPAQSAGAQGPLAPAVASSLAATDAISTTFTYQGRLEDGDGPVTGTCDFRFALYAASAGGSPLATKDKNAEPVTDGYFDVGLDFGADAFAGQRRWLGIQVRCESETSYTDLGRQELTPAPCALHAADAWSLTGNSGTTPGPHFLGTTDDVTLTLGVNGSPALRLVPHATSPNLIGGYGGNTVSAGVVGATISGGGNTSQPNRVTDDYGTVGGGYSNQAGIYATVGGGEANSAVGSYTTIGGGGANAATVPFATVGGGEHNYAFGEYATVGGGYHNEASGDYATLPGGSYCDAIGDYATAPGGYYNNASGDYSFAAGRQAQAVHHGTFVWADSTAADFASTGADQFLVRATGGVSFTTQGAPFHVNGRPIFQPTNVILVAQSGGDTTSVQAAIDAIADAAADNPYLVWVAPGVYNEAVTLKPHVHLQGAGQGATVISSAASSSGSPPTASTVILAERTSLRDLTVVNTGSGAYNVALLATAGTTATLVADVTARAEGSGTNNHAIDLSGSGTGVTLRHVTAGAEDGSQSNYGMHNDGATMVTVNGGSFTGRGGTYAVGIRNSATALTADDVTALGENGSTMSAGLRNAADTILHGGSFTGRGGSAAYGIYHPAFSYKLVAEGVVALAEDGVSSTAGLENLGVALLLGGSFIGRGGSEVYGVYNYMSDATLEAESITALGENGTSTAKGLYNIDGTAVLRGGSFTGRGEDNPRGIQNEGASADLTTENVTVLAEGGLNTYAVLNYQNAVATLRGGSVIADANDISASKAFGIYNLSSGGLTVERVTVVGERSDDNRGLYSFNAPVTIDSSQLAGDTNQALYQQGSTIYVGVSQLNGGATRTSGTLNCFQIYDGNYAGYSCP